MEKSMKQKNSVKTYKLKTKEYHIPSSGVVVISAVITSKTSITLMIAWPAEGFNAILSDFPLIDIVAFKTRAVYRSPVMRIRSTSLNMTSPSINT
jgi:hypothetical protein